MILFSITASATAAASGRRAENIAASAWFRAAPAAAPRRAAKTGGRGDPPSGAGATPGGPAAPLKPGTGGDPALTIGGSTGKLSCRGNRVAYAACSALSSARGHPSGRPLTEAAAQALCRIAMMLFSATASATAAASGRRAENIAASAWFRAAPAAAPRRTAKTGGRGDPTSRSGAAPASCPAGATGWRMPPAVRRLQCSEFREGPSIRPTSDRDGRSGALPHRHDAFLRHGFGQRRRQRPLRRKYCGFCMA